MNMAARGTSDQPAARIAAGLRSLGIPAEDLPGFIATFVLAAATAKFIPIQSVSLGILPALERLPDLLPNIGALAQVVIAFAFTLVFYSLGKVWDHVWDRLYSINYDASDPSSRDGFLSGTDGRPWEFLLLLPGGVDLAEDRHRAQSKAGSIKKGIYAHALDSIRPDLADGGDGAERVLASQARQAFCRTLILPALLLGAAAAAGHVHQTTGLPADKRLALAVSWIALVFGLFVAFVNERVDHARAVYRRFAGSEQPSAPPPPESYFKLRSRRLCRTLPCSAGAALFAVLMMAAAMWPYVAQRL